MSSVVYSSELHQIVRSLKGFNSEEIAKFFKDKNWFEVTSISKVEAMAVEKLFTKPDERHIQNSDVQNSWY